MLNMNDDTLGGYSLVLNMNDDTLEGYSRVIAVNLSVIVYVYL